MQKYTEHIDEIENLYKENLDDISIDSSGMWEAFEKQLPPANTIVAGKNIQNDFNIWLKLSVLLNIVLAGGWIVFFLERPSNMEWKISTSGNGEGVLSKKQETSTSPVVNSTLNDQSKSSDKFPIKKDNIGNPIQSSGLLDTTVETNTVINGLSESPKVSEEIKPKEETIKTQPSDSLTSNDIKEYYKMKKGTQKLFK